MPTSESVVLPSSSSDVSVVTTDADKWHLLEQLLQQLDASRNPHGQIQLTLDAVRKATGADIVYWHSPSSGDCVSCDGEPLLAAPMRQAFARERLARMSTEGGSALWRRRQDAEHSTVDFPATAAIVRLGKSSSTCMVAANFNPERPLDAGDVRLVSLATRLLVKQTHHRRMQEQLKDTLLGTLQCLTALIEAKDSYTCGHSERVSRIAVLIGEKLDLSEKVLSDLHLAGLLHDIGKIGVRDEVLLKGGPLTPDEMAHVREHVVIGDRVVSEIKHFSALRPGIRSHHERYDGTGYPDHLAGEAIPILGRILAVADACDAMMSPRRYRPALTPPQIDATLTRLAGTQWDPKVVDGFMACRWEVYPPIYQKGIGESAFHALDHAVGENQDGSSAVFRFNEMN